MVKDQNKWSMILFSELHLDRICEENWDPIPLCKYFEVILLVLYLEYIEDLRQKCRIFSH